MELEEKNIQSSTLRGICCHERNVSLEKKKDCLVYQERTVLFAGSIFKELN